jgi:hypothetical protein
MNGWLILFIILCAFAGPGYITAEIANYFLPSNPTVLQIAGTLGLSALVVGVPFAAVGYMAFT